MYSKNGETQIICILKNKNAYAIMPIGRRKLQTKPAATVTKKEIATSMKTHPPAVGYRLGNTEIISRIPTVFHIYFSFFSC